MRYNSFGKYPHACHECVKVPLQALEIMCRGAKGEAEAVLKQMHIFAAAVDSQLASAQTAAAAAASRRCSSAATLEEIDGEAEEGGGSDQQGAPGDDATIDQIEDYFLKRQQVRINKHRGLTFVRSRSDSGKMWPGSACESAWIVQTI